MAQESKYAVIVCTLLVGAVLCAQDASQPAQRPNEAQGVQFQWPQVQGPQNLALVLDCSARAERRFESLRRAAVESVKHLTETDVVSVVVYDDHASVLVPAQTAKNLEAVIAKLEALKPRGDAALFAGLSAAAEELRKNRDDKFTNRMFVLNASPGNVGPHSEGELWNYVDALAKENIRVLFAGMMRRGGPGVEGRPGGFRGRFGNGRSGGFGTRGFGPPRMRLPRRQSEDNNGDNSSPVNEDKISNRPATQPPSQ